MIISLFGPDGVGKSTIGERMASELQVPIISGSDISTWPDTSWYESFISRDIVERKINDMDHFFEKTIRAHEQARLLDEAEGGVIIDSDPVHKIFTHRHMTGRSAGLLVFLEDLADYHGDHERTNVHVRLARQGTPQVHAIELQRRITLRGVDSIFDPTTVSASLAMIHASDALEAELRAIREEVRTAYSYEPGVPFEELDRVE